MPKGTSAPGNVSTWPTTVPPLPVPTNGLTRAAGSVTGLVVVLAAACAVAGVRVRAAARAARGAAAGQRGGGVRRCIGRLRGCGCGGPARVGSPAFHRAPPGLGLRGPGADNDVKPHA